VSAQRDLMIIALSASVPLFREEFRDRSPEWLIGEASRMSTILGSQGDVLQYGGGKPGTAAGAFNALARGLACAALIAEGGVDWLGQHWCSDPLCTTSHIG